MNHDDDWLLDDDIISELVKKRQHNIGDTQEEDPSPQQYVSFHGDVAVEPQQTVTITTQAPTESVAYAGTLTNFSSDDSDEETHVHVTPPPPSSTTKNLKSNIADVWHRAKGIVSWNPLHSQSPSPDLDPLHASGTVDDEVTMDSPKGSIKVPVPKFREMLYQVFPFDDFPGSYCAFGSFRRRTSSLSWYSTRALEVIPPNLDQPAQGGKRSGPPPGFKEDFMIHSSVACDSKNKAGAEGANQFFLFSAGPKFAHVRVWCVCRGYDKQGGFLADWVAFFFARRLLGGLQPSLSDPHASISTSSASQRLEPKRISLDQPADLRDLLRLVHAEVAEDFVSAFGEISYVAPLTTMETDGGGYTGSSLMKGFGDSGVIVHSGITVDDNSVCVLSNLGGIPACIGSRRRLPIARRPATRSSIDNGRRSIKGSTATCTLAAPIFPTSHTMNDSAERHRVGTAAARAFHKALENDMKRNSGHVTSSGGLQRRLLASNRAKALQLTQDAKSTHGTAPSEPPPEEATLTAKSPTKRSWVEKAVGESPIGRFGFTRGIGFLSANHLGLVSTPDFVEVPIIISKIPAATPSMRIPDSFMSQSARMVPNLLGPKSLPPSSVDIAPLNLHSIVPSSVADDPVDASPSGTVVLRHFIFIVSSPLLIKFISLQEMVTFLCHKIEHNHVSIQASLKCLARYVRRHLASSTSAAASVLLKEELTFLLVPLQVSKISYPAP